MKQYFIILVHLMFIACRFHENKNTSESVYQNRETNEITAVEDEDKVGNINDGTYYAEVDYYNPNTGTSSSYNLKVDVEDNTVTVIHFNNGGWIDETHIVSGGELEDGETTIITDKGYEYTVIIEK